MPDQDSELDETPGLVRALRVVRERWWLLALCAVVSLAAAVLYVGRKPNQYTATSSLQFTANSIPSQVAGVSSGQPTDPEGEKNTNVQLVTTIPVAAAVIRQLHLHMTPPELLGHVKASDSQNSYLVDIEATDGDSGLAAQIANAFAQQYVNYSRQQNEEQLISGQRLIARQAARLPPGDTTDRANLNALSQKLLLLQAVATANARIANTANVPGSPSSPNRKGTAIAALVFGLLLGTGLAFLFNLLNTRVGSWEEFEKLYGFPLLAGIPQGVRTDAGKERDSDLEPFRILQQSLPLLAGGGAVRSALVTSAVPGEGKTTVAIGLARAASHLGTEVVLVECDLRRPSFSERMDVDARSPGLAEALFDDEDPLELLQAPYADRPRLQILPAGRVRADAQGQLHPRHLARVFEALGAYAGLVVIDSAPLLPVVDTRVLLDTISLDVELIVARAGVTKREDIRNARAIFEQRRLRKSVGLVANAVPTQASYYYYDSRAESSARDERGATRDRPSHAASQRL